MSSLSLQVKVNTKDPTHGAAVSAFNESALPGQAGTPGVNGRGGGWCRPYGTASSVRCGAFRKPSFTRLVIFHHPSLFHHLSPSLPRARSSLCPRPFLMPSEHAGASSNMHPRIDTRSRRQTQKQTKTQEGHTHRTHTHNQKVSKEVSYLISSVIALSSTSSPLVSWLHSDSQKEVQFISRRRFGINQHLWHKNQRICTDHIKDFIHRKGKAENRHVSVFLVFFCQPNVKTPQISKQQL